MRASFTSTGRRAICRPIAVSCAAPCRPRRVRPAVCQPSAIARGSGGSRNGKSSTRPRPSDSMRRITPGQRGAQDFRIGVTRTRLEVGFGIQAVADAGGDAPAAALALVGAGLRDRLDVQAVELLPRAVALDPRRARVDHVADARHGQRGLGDIGGQHDAALRCRDEHAVLVARRQPRVQRQHFGVRGTCAVASARCASRISRSPGRNTSMSPRGSSRVISSAAGHDRIGHRKGRRCARPGLITLRPLVFQRAVAHLDRIAAAFDADHRRIVEMPGEALGVDGRRGDDQLQVAAASRSSCFR